MESTPKALAEEIVANAKVHPYGDYTAKEVLPLAEAFIRVLYIAQNLNGMIPLKVWRDQGGYDGQGHYEGDYYAEQVNEELNSYE